MTTAGDVLATAVRLQQDGKLDEAEALCQQVLAVEPAQPDALHLLGLIAHQRGGHELAVENIGRAIAAQPGNPRFHFDLARALRARGDDEAASLEYRQVLNLQPNHAPTLVDCGTLLQDAGGHAESLKFLERALRARPDSAEAHFHRAVALRKLRRTSEAVLALHEAVRYRPNYSEAYVELAAIYSLDGQPDEAVRYCQAGIAAGAVSAALYDMLALALHSQGKGSEAIECCRRSVELAPQVAARHSHLLYVLNFEAGIDPQTLFEEHLEWSRRHAEPLTARAAPHDNDRSPDRRLRIGYVSPHFRQHAVNYFSEPILLAHDREQYEIFCYSSVAEPDATTDRIKSSVDHWRNVCSDSDAQVAARVRDDRIDILVDLSGHLGANRLLAFARKPAPVQVTYIGYQNTTGMLAMDYRLTDERADPPGETDRYYSEQLVRLPRTFFCYKPTPAPDVSPSPASANGWITFGSFNNYAKVSPAAVDAWLEILSRVPESRLIVLGYSPGVLERHWHALAERRGIAAQRIELTNRCSRTDYLRLIARADVALDPFPCNGHTTICDALWMGLPVVMLEGQMYANRYGGTALAHVGLTDLIATSTEQYVDIAVRLAGDRGRLAGLRRNLRQTFSDSVLLDAAGFTSNLEAAYRQMWRAWCQTRDQS